MNDIGRLNTATPSYRMNNKPQMDKNTSYGEFSLAYFYSESIRQTKMNNKKIFSKQMKEMMPKETQELVAFYSNVGPVKLKKVFKNLSLGQRKYSLFLLKNIENLEMIQSIFLLQNTMETLIQ